MTDFVKASQVFLDNHASSVEEALAFFARKAVELGLSDDEAAVLDALKAREAEGTTGMLSGFAIPHCKCSAIRDAAVMVVKFADGVSWDSMDGQPIKVAIALLAPDGEVATTFLRTLSQVAVMLMDESFRKKVLAADDEAAIAEIINSALDA
ncbi:MAG: fructose PTS transporter subunit IIA [Acidobacteriota bacterium]|nr:fructose PTS transporter subunit IIA [Acidobacteriota bacterium]